MIARKSARGRKETPAGPPRRETILSVFEKLVSHFGLDKVTMLDVAREVGISVGTIYLDFQNKEALIEAIEEKWLSGIDRYNAGIVKSDDTPEKKLYLITVEHIKHFSQEIRGNRAMFELLMGTLHIKYIHRKVTNKQEEIFESMTQSVKAVMREGRELKVFDIKNVEQTAQLFVTAFCDFFLAPRIVAKEHQALCKSAEGMFTLLMKAIKA